MLIKITLIAQCSMLMFSSLASADLGTSTSSHEASLSREELVKELNALEAQKRLSVTSEGPGSASEVKEEKQLPMSTQILFAVVLLGLSAIFAGLTLGIMGMDTVTLEIVADAGSEPDATYARTILPVRKLGHQALCTLILGNMWANVMIAQFCAGINPEGGGGGSGSGAIMAFLMSTFLILIFAEILPMSICKSSRALQIAAQGVPILQAFLIILYPIAKPLGLALDKLIPHEAGQIYDRSELKRLMDVHASSKHSATSGLRQNEVALMMGVMEFREKALKDILTPLKACMMLPHTKIVDAELIHEIWQSGRSRIPVYNANIGPHRIAGILYAKDLILVRPEANLSVVDLLLMYPHGHVLSVAQSTPLQKLLQLMQSQQTHIAVVYDDASLTFSAADRQREQEDVELQEICRRNSSPTEEPYSASAVGIVTLEDLVELMIKSDIEDEHDKKTVFMNFWTFSCEDKLLALSQKVGNSTAIKDFFTDEQIISTAEFMNRNIDSFLYWSREAVIALLERSKVEIIEPASKCRDANTSITDLSLAGKNHSSILCEKGKLSECMYLIIGGGVRLTAGVQQLTTELRSWSYLSEAALTGQYQPGYTAVVSRRSLILKVSRWAYRRTMAESRAGTLPSSSVKMPAKR